MNIQQLRHSLKVKWLLYYRQHRPWLTKIRIWDTFDGQRRPSSSFILATLTNLEPQLIQMLPFITALSNDPDKIVAALGLNFNPEAELKALTTAATAASNLVDSNGQSDRLPAASLNGNGSSSQMPPPSISEVRQPPPTQVRNLSAWVDESCHGSGGSRHTRKL